MMRIALPLSKPVLGYLALLAFMGAYGSFLYAFLVAQDQKMWTLMVYIYQLQTQGAPRSLLMAALTLAALPTLIVFLLCQRVIMKGIVLPGER
jgi:multiple sugar transport system permease protein